MTVNLDCAYLARQPAMAPMHAQRFGRIINIGSVLDMNRGMWCEQPC